MNELIKPEGRIEIIIDHKDGFREILKFKNKVLRTGRSALASCLANDFGSSFEFFIDGIVWGAGGTSGGSPRFVSDDREGLFGVTIASKAVITSIDPETPTTVVFTSVLDFDEANSAPLNEVALKMKNEEFFSMSTFGDVTKSSSMQLTINWSISFV